MAWWDCSHLFLLSVLASRLIRDWGISIEKKIEYWNQRAIVSRRIVKISKYACCFSSHITAWVFVFAFSSAGWRTLRSRNLVCRFLLIYNGSLFVPPKDVDMYGQRPELHPICSQPYSELHASPSAAAISNNYPQCLVVPGGNHSVVTFN